MTVSPPAPATPSLPSWAEHASNFYKAGDIGRAIEVVEARVRTHPEDIAAWHKLARWLTEIWQFARADAVITHALTVAGDDTQLLALQVFVKQGLGQTGVARTVATNAAARHPTHPSFLFDSKLLIPTVYADQADLAARRAQYDAGLAELESMLLLMQQDPGRIFKLERSNFLLAYQGEDDLQLQRRYADLLGAMIAAADPALREAPLLGLRSPLARQPGRGRKLRVGFVGKWFFSCTAGNYFERWITKLDAARFERFVYYTGHVSDEVTARIGKSAEHFSHLHNDVRSNAYRIRADELDILIYPEVGMSTSSYLLASCRLAPLQCAGWGHPVTTGNRAIDVYLSCAEMEPPDYQSHYSERVSLLDGIGVDVAMPAVDMPGHRADFGLPATGHLYFCPQSIFKIHPDMDEALATILERDNAAVLVFFQADSRAITMAFADRLTKVFAARSIDAKGQIKFLPRLSTRVFRMVLKLADVVLDPFRWSGGGTSLDAFAGDVPVVTLPGRFMRGRQTAAMLRMLGAESLIAMNVDEYVRTAIEVATNRTMNRDLRALIHANKRAVFEREDLNGQFADVLFALASEPATRGA